MASKTARRHAREQALMMLFGMDMAKQWPDAAIEGFYGCFAGGPMDPAPAWDPYSGPGYEIDSNPDARAYAEQLVRGVSGHLAELDAAIQKISHHWKLPRMACVDRNLLRLGAYELLHPSPDVPRKVALNEAVELAKTFSTADSSAFVNGILDRLSK